MFSSKLANCCKFDERIAPRVLFALSQKPAQVVSVLKPQGYGFSSVSYVDDQYLVSIVQSPISISFQSAPLVDKVVHDNVLCFHLSSTFLCL